MTTGAARLCLVGASDDTGNLGVGALMHSVVAALATRRPDAHLTVFDHGYGTRVGALAGPSGAYRFHRVGMRHSRRVHRPESLWNIGACARAGGLWNRGARALLSADAVWDVSGGDSFGDLYGPRRWKAVTEPKRLVLGLGGRLLLLPQTYGPYRGRAHREVAADIVRAATMAWARDPDSYATLAQLLGADLDERRHRLGVDVAFGLVARAPGGQAAEWLDRWLASAGSRPTVGLNVSGLCFNMHDAHTTFGLRAGYATTVRSLLRQLLDRTEARVLLVPHVRGAGAESDDAACARLAAVAASRRDDVTVLPAGLDPAETKWVISQLDWFCGTRMHSTIAALSSGVPAAAIAYSGKTRGVFATCGVADQVADARSLTADEVTTVVLEGFHRRDSVRRRLHDALPAVLATVQQQMDDILSASVGPHFDLVSAAGRR